MTAQGLHTGRWARRLAMVSLVDEPFSEKFGRNGNRQTPMAIKTSRLFGRRSIWLILATQGRASVIRKEVSFEKIGAGVIESVR